MTLFIKQINTMLYADDATISASGKHIVDIENTISDSENSASDWCPKNDMILSLPKCNTLIISSKKQHSIRNVDIIPTSECQEIICKQLYIYYFCVVWGNCSITLEKSLKKILKNQ